MDYETQQRLRTQIAHAESLGMTELAAIGQAALDRAEARQVDETDGLPLGQRLANELAQLADDLRG